MPCLSTGSCVLGPRARSCAYALQQHCRRPLTSKVAFSSNESGASLQFTPLELWKDALVTRPKAAIAMDSGTKEQEERDGCEEL